MLQFRLLGQASLLKDDQPLQQFRSQKEAVLLYYLAQTGETHPREFVADLLWEASSTKQSLTNLRTVLSRLRKRVGDALVVTRKTVALDANAVGYVDSVYLLEELESIGQIDVEETAVSLQNTLNTYQGDFLADFHLVDSTAFNDWAATTRQQIRQQVIAGFDKLVRYWQKTGNHASGIDATRQWLQLDPLDEAAHTLLVQLLLDAGKTRDALAAYENCVTLLRAELDIAPPAALTALVTAARPKRAVVSSVKTAVRHNLPPAYDQFFGRQTVLQEIHTRLDQPWCRLVTLTGQGGVGKTRLSLTIGRSRMSQYRDGVWLVELADLDADDDDLAEAIAVEIATLLDLRLTGGKTPNEQLVEHLQHKQMLLLLDNFEHLVGGRQIVLDIVQQCDEVQLIVTSREALRLRAEWTVALEGLAYPDSDKDAQPSDAVALFTARRAQQQWSQLDADEQTAVRTICRMVEGLPLAIELAAAMTNQMSARAVLARLQNGFDTLLATFHDIPERHRALRVVFEMSWQTLTPTLQLRLARLAVFRGGFTAVAAQQISNSDATHLAALGEKSLLTHSSATERYVLHPVIRAYAAEHRPANDLTRSNHAAYYLTLLAQHTEPLQKKRPQDSVNLLEPDIENVRRAWQTGLEQHEAQLLTDALTSLSIYYQLRGLAREGEAVMQTTLKTAQAWGADGTPLATRAGLERARFQNRLGRYRPAIKTIQTTLKLTAQTNDRWAEGMAHVWWGESLWRMGKYDTAKDKLNHALTIANELQANLIYGWCQHQLGIINDIQGHYDVAYEHLTQACKQWKELNNTNNLSVSLNSIGLVQYHKGNLHRAQEAMEQTLVLSQQIDNRHLQTLLFSNLSIIATEMQDFLGAEFYLQLSLEMADTNSNLSSLADIHVNLGRNYNNQGEFEQAIIQLEKGLEIASKIENRKVMSLALMYLGEISRKQNRMGDAIGFYEQTLSIARQDGLQWVECKVLIGLAQVENDLNDKQRIREYTDRALLLAEKLQNPELLERAKSINV